eukprot:scaffold3651_cov128-Skeletonema_dohrnii-CCMP3373.AAC.3
MPSQTLPRCHQPSSKFTWILSNSLRNHGLIQRSVPIAVVDIVEYLLSCDPNVKLQKDEGTKSLLHDACRLLDSNIHVALETIQLIYDAHPEAIENDEMVSDIHEFHEQVQSLINGELVYYRKAKDHRLMTTLDDNGQLPLHTALQSNARLGSIKLLGKGNPSAIRTFDRSGVHRDTFAYCMSAS